MFQTLVTEVTSGSVKATDQSSKVKASLQDNVPSAAIPPEMCPSSQKACPGGVYPLISRMQGGALSSLLSLGRDPSIRLPNQVPAKSNDSQVEQETRYS